jgi:hypothetical protein
MVTPLPASAIGVGGVVETIDPEPPGPLRNSTLLLDNTLKDLEPPAGTLPKSVLWPVS